MITDSVPKRKSRLEEYMLSDSMASLLLPPADELNALASAIEIALKEENRKEIEKHCNAIA